MSGQAEVEVLLATFNGERFLREQINSILAQDYKYLSVLARDDGSTDGTMEILEEFAKRFPARFRVMSRGPATGRAKDNFLLLLKETVADYICFSDQDDVWVPDKVMLTRRAMDQLEHRWGRNIPLLVFTDLRVVDEKLHTIHESLWTYERLNPERMDRFAELLGQNVVTGCTAMLNRRLINLSLRMPREAVLHDQWIALLTSAMGKFTAIKAQTVLYRQHDQNVVGSKKKIGSLQEFIQRLDASDARILQLKSRMRQARAFVKVHDADLSAVDRDTIQAFLRCGTSRSRLFRIHTFITRGFLRPGVLQRLSTMFDLLIMKADEHEDICDAKNTCPVRPRDN